MTGRIVLVTGGGTGIGAGITQWFADHGDQVVIVQPSHEGALEAANHIRTTGPAVVGIGADLSSARGCRAAVGRTLDLFGQIDILVNNAAVTGPRAIGPFLDLEEVLLDEIVDTNLKAALRCAQLAGRDMAERGDGVIVNIASVGAFVGQLEASTYVATKAGLVGLTKSLALELATSGIRVVGVAPGDIDTRAQGIQGELAVGQWARRTPIGRRGTPEDIGSAVGFLCSPQAGFITGETLVVDGGWLSY